jgi:hypothetical protein
MPDIDKMSLKELRAMLKGQRKEKLAPVSKMKKGQLMKELITTSNLAQIGSEFQNPQPVREKKTAEQILMKSHKEKEYIPLEGYLYGAEEIERPGAKRFARVTGKVREAQATKYKISDDTLQQPVSRKLGKESLMQTDQAVEASQKVAPRTKKQTAKKTVKAEPDQPVGTAMRAVAESMVLKPKRGRPPKNAGMAVGVGQVASSVAPIQLVISPTGSSVGYHAEDVYEPVRPPPAQPNLTRLVAPMRPLGRGVMGRNPEYVEKNVIINEPMGIVKKEVKKIDTKEKSKRGGWDNLTAEQKAERIAKMKAGKDKKKE